MDVFKNCTISNVVRKNIGLASLAFDILTETGESNTIQIQNRDYQERLENLLDGKVTHVAFAHGMTDIDIWREHDGYRIEWSPFEGSYVNYIVSKNEARKLLQCGGASR